MNAVRADRRPARGGESTLSAEGLRAFMEARGWGVSETSRQIGSTPASVSLWASGRRPIPPYIARLVEVMQELDTVAP